MSTTPTRTSLQDLHDLAAGYGVVVECAALPDDLLGCYVPLRSRIYLDTRLTPAEERSVLAHEIGHAHHGHARARARSAEEAARWERQAEAFAADLLIDRVVYAELERISDDPNFLADELGVTVSLVHAFRGLCRDRLTAARSAPRRPTTRRAARTR